MTTQQIIGAILAFGIWVPIALFAAYYWCKWDDFFKK